jgi:hypothetical protein
LNAVGVDSAEVGGDERVGGEPGFVGGNARSLEDSLRVIAKRIVVENDHRTD